LGDVFLNTKIYLDHAATTPIRPEVANIIHQCGEFYANPSSIHEAGQQARKAVEAARLKVADAIGARPHEIFFTSGGTEADNWAIRGVSANLQNGGHIITTAIEHPAVRNVCRAMEQLGYDVTYLNVDSDGLINVKDFEAAIRRESFLATIMLANNEIGTIQPIAEISEIAKRYGVLLHTDAVQAVGHIPVNVDALGVDLLSLSGHKLYAPKGIGVLYVREGTQISPLFFGGGQEKNKRPGTENVVGIVGLGHAIELAVAELETEGARLTVLRDEIIRGVYNLVPGAKLNGHSVKRLPGNVNFSFSNINGESVLFMLDMQGLYVSGASACSAGKGAPSHVLLAIGRTANEAIGSIRISLGAQNTKQDVARILEVLPPVIEKLTSA